MIEGFSLLRIHNILANNAMRFPMSSCLLYRHSISLKSLNTQNPVIFPSRAASSLSAIHNGLRQSHKSRPQGFNPSSLETPRPRRSSQTARNSRDPNWTPPTFKISRGKKDVTDTGPGPQSRRKRFNDPENSFGKRSLVYQMKHGDLKDKLTELETRRSYRTPTSRRSDRLSPGDFMRDFNSGGGGAGSPAKGRDHSKGRDREFGKSHARGFGKDHSRSFGDDKSRSFSGDKSRSFGGDKSRDFGGKERSRDFGSDSNRGFRDDKNRSFGGDKTRSRGNDKRRSFQDDKSRDFGKEPSRIFSNDSSRGFNKERSGDFSKDFTESATRPVANIRTFDSEHPRRTDGSFSETRSETFADTSSTGPRRDFFTDRSEQPGRTRNNDEQDTRREKESRKTDDGPIRIHHTTAASQFLYGRSVVEAALKESRRQLYKLYIYSGEDRQNISQDDMLVKLAQQKGVDVTKVPNDGLRMMDKMSGGRPHNGCILEASPLPQLPLKALGSLSIVPQKPGFDVIVNHQSSEEAEINGTSNFVQYELPKGRKPFVLLLDGILDPGNLGAILRTAAFLGVNGIAITKDSSATLTAVALKASAGASEVATLFSVNSTLDFLARSKENGWLVYAAVPSTKRSRGNSHLTVDRIDTYDPLSLQPTLLVVGSEGEGLSKPVRRLADHEVSIPGASSGFLSVVDSLNVSVATGILCSAFLRKQSSGMIEVSDEPTEGEDDSEAKMW
ncbi:RNA methyltransferase [Hypoxylon argillaceum]|nr:RNA methyltransferase [Hypoxylon argillaceum]